MKFLQADIAVRNIETINSKVKVSTLTEIVIYFGGAVLAIGLVGLIWAIATNSSKSKEYLVSWIIGLMFYLLFIL